MQPLIKGLDSCKWILWKILRPRNSPLIYIDTITWSSSTLRDLKIKCTYFQYIWLISWDMAVFMVWPQTVLSSVLYQLVGRSISTQISKEANSHSRLVKRQLDSYSHFTVHTTGCTTQSEIEQEYCHESWHCIGPDEMPILVLGRRKRPQTKMGST